MEMCAYLRVCVSKISIDNELQHTDFWSIWYWYILAIYMMSPPVF